MEIELQANADSSHPPVIKALELIRTGSVEGIDTSCVRSPPPTQFEIS